MYISVADGGETFESENRRDGDSGGTVEDKSPERGYAAHGRIAPVAFGSCRFWKREFLKRTHGNAMFDVYRNNALRGSVVSVLILIDQLRLLKFKKIQSDLVAVSFAYRLFYPFNNFAL